ncbi:MAG TPA: hypothetical protein VFD00_08370 [Thermoclostridium sp.]|nr:hypothetical protein [Thermoclostridium sp.]
MRTITRIAVIKEGLVINTYPSIVDTAKGEGLDYSWLFNRIKNNKSYKGRTFIRTEYQHTPIICFYKGRPQATVLKLFSASLESRLTEEDIINLLESGEEKNGWSFDEVGEEYYPKTLSYRGRLYHRGYWGYKCAKHYTSYYHRDLYQDEHGDIGNLNVQVRNANRWNCKLENLFLE